MENITKEIIIDYINKSEIELYSTHERLCLPVIIRIYKKMQAGIKFPGIKIEDSLICDGHHRYLASILACFPLERIRGSKTSAMNRIPWEEVAFDEEDWDTPAKINMLNRQDAEFNNVSLGEIVELLK